MRFLTSTLLMIALAVAGWHYAPQNAKEGVLGIVGIAKRGNTAEVKHFIEDVVLPKDPAERRSALTSELEKNIAELKRRIVAGKDDIAAFGSSPAPDAKICAASSQDLISASEEIVKELESANKDMSVGEKATQRILDAVLPVKQSPVCPVK